MSSELGLLALYGLFVIAVILLQVLMAIPQLGLPYLMGNRAEGRSTEGAAARIDNAQANCIQGLALIVPAVLIVTQMGLGSAATVLAMQIFLLARIVYVVVYTLGVPVLRTLAWTVALLANIWLYLVPFLAAAA